MNFRCDDALLQLYAEGGLEPEELAIVESHVAGCRRCRQQVARYKLLLFDLEHQPPAPVPTGLQAVSDHLMAAWEAQCEAGTPPLSVAEASMLWTRTPVIQDAFGRAGEVGRRMLRPTLSGVGRLVRRSLFGQGGGRR